MPLESINQSINQKTIEIMGLSDAQHFAGKLDL